MEHLRFPIGQYQAPQIVSIEQREAWINDIEMLPEQLCSAVAGLSAQQLDTAYRNEGWTLRQVVHHIADSHINAYTRYKLAVTENNPTIRPYDEKYWAELDDAKNEAVEISLAIIEAVHRRWVIHLRNMSEDDWQKTFYHPQSKITFQLDKNLGLYSWHGRHHLAHITTTKDRLGW